jgi:enterochelin esterase-like enzyme
MLTLLPVIEKELRVRRGYRMRSVAGFREGAPVALALGMLPEQFGSCLLTDAVMTGQDATALLSGATRDSMRRTWLFIDAPDKGSCSEGNGNAHMILRDRNVQHEYRVREGSGGPEWSEGGFIETLKFAANRFHK